MSSGLVPLLLAQGIFTKSMNEIIDPMNQVLPRLQAPPRRTSFEREPAAMDYASRPTPAGSAGWSSSGRAVASPAVGQSCR